MVTPGGAPLTFGANNARGVIVRDPDGHFVELLQPSPLPETSAPPESNIIDARVRITVADTDRAMQLYRDQFQFQPQVGSFGTIPLLDLMGLKGSQVRLTTAQVPGSALRMEFVEIKGADRFADSSAHSGSGRDAAADSRQGSGLDDRQAEGVGLERGVDWRGAGVVARWRTGGHHARSRRAVLRPDSGCAATR